jgi:hypothetical protein
MMNKKPQIKTLIAGTVLTAAMITGAQAYSGNQIVPVTCAAVFDAASREYSRTGRTQDADVSSYLSQQFAQYTIRTAQDSSSARINTRKQLRAAADMERVTAEINGGMRYLQPRIGACIGLADRLGI